MEKLRSNLGELLSERGLKGALAIYLKTSASYITHLAKGHHTPRVDTALRIARFCGRKVEEIWGLANGKDEE